MYTEFSLFEKLFGLLFWENNYTVSNKDINTGGIKACSNAGSGEICLSWTLCIKDYFFPQCSERTIVAKWVNILQHPTMYEAREIIFFLYVVLSIVSPFFLNLLFPDGVGLEVVCTEWFWEGGAGLLRIASTSTLLLFSALSSKTATHCMHLLLWSKNGNSRQNYIVEDGKQMLWSVSGNYYNITCKHKGTRK